MLFRSGEEKRDNEDESREVRDLYNFKGGSWLTASLGTGLTIGYMAGKETKIRLTRQCCPADFDLASHVPDRFKGIGPVFRNRCD